MRFQVSHHLQQPVGHQAQYDLRQRHLRLDDEAVLIDLEGSMTVLRTDRGLLVSLVASCHLRETCSRCLAPMDCRLDLDFQEEYLPTVDVNTGSPLAVGGGDDDFHIDANFVLDLGEALRQYTVMSMPSKPLCKPDCRGLCPRCGQNLNPGPCPCPPEQDERWEALTGLADTLKQGEEG